MATLLHRVLDNFYWRIGAISPTYSGEGRPVGRFRAWDVEDGRDPAKGTGWTRRFWVEWLGSDEDIGATTNEIREAWHTYRVHVIYPRRQGSHRRTMAMIAQDRHDLCRHLRGAIATDHRLGYDDDNPTTNIGLAKRVRTGDELRLLAGNDKIYELVLEWTCFVLETE